MAIIEDEADQARALLERKVRPGSAPPPSATPPRAPTSATPPRAPASAQTPPSTQRPASSTLAATPARPPARGQAVPPARPSQQTSGRSRLVTLDYQEPAPGGGGERESSAPELIDMGVQPIGRETLAAITGDLAQELLRALTIEERTEWLLQMEESIVLEPFRFEVRGAPMLARPNDALRREFVSAKLLHRLPVRSMDQIDRVDATPTADEGLTLTVWVKIPESR